MIDPLDQAVLDDLDFMRRSLAPLEGGHPLYTPNPFWATLGEQHVRMLREAGFRRFKRTVNIHYGHWRVNRFLLDPKLVHLLRYFIARTRIPWILFSIHVGRNDRLGASAFSPFAYRVFMGLLWERALLADSLGCLDVCHEPTLGDPIDVRYRGELISQDLAQSSLELNLIAAQVHLPCIRKVMEIGAGYGRLCWVMLTMFPHLEYAIFDIPPALVIAQNYLGHVLGGGHVESFKEREQLEELKPGVRARAFLPHQLELFSDGYFDLAINISAFDEMQPKQVDCYFDLIGAKCRGWLYLKGYRKSRTGGLGLEELPYRPGWLCVYNGCDPINPEFAERIYRLGP